MAAYTAIDDPTLHFQVVTYSGNGAANNAITLPGDTDMQPDVVWIKNREQADSYCLFNSLYGATIVKHTDTGVAFSTDADTLDAFQTDGFRVDADVKVNTDGEGYVAYCWKMGTTSGIAGSPSITPAAYTFNQTADQSVIQFTGTDANATIPHGLGVAPHVVVTPHENPPWYHHKNTSAPETDYVQWSTTAATNDVATFWNDTAPTSTLVSLGGSSQTNSGGSNICAYTWAGVQGYSKFGGYTGNGDADGPFIYTGFKPAFFMCKNTNTTDQWCLVDNKRGVNGAIGILFPEVADAENATETGVELLSNGIKIRSTGGFVNGSGNTIIYWAFAEAPFVNSEGVPGNAR